MRIEAAQAADVASIYELAATCGFDVENTPGLAHDMLRFSIRDDPAGVLIAHDEVVQGFAVLSLPMAIDGSYERSSRKAHLRACVVRDDSKDASRATHHQLCSKSSASRSWDRGTPVAKYNLRWMTGTDLDTVIELAVAHARAVGRRPYPGEELHDDVETVDRWLPWTLINHFGYEVPSDKAQVAVDEHGRVVGYIALAGLRILSFAVCRDELWDSVAADLLRAVAAGAEGPLAVHCDVNDLGARRALEAAGFRAIRNRYTRSL